MPPIPPARENAALVNAAHVAQQAEALLQLAKLNPQFKTRALWHSALLKNALLSINAHARRPWPIQELMRALNSTSTTLETTLKTMIKNGQLPNVYETNLDR